jgi:nitrate/nitrite-specific signal transduction histidine kinase
MQHRRRILLINRKFQLKFTLFVCSWVVILSLALPLGLRASLSRFLEILSKTVNPEALQQIESFHYEVFRVYGVALLIAVGILFWLCIILSHRIAGPVYRIQSALERWKRGNVEHHLALRKDDHFEDLAKAYNEAANEYIELRNQVRAGCEKLEGIGRELDMKHRTQIQEIIGDLQCGNQKKS